jgi:hypothetical protein
MKGRYAAGLLANSGFLYEIHGTDSKQTKEARRPGVLKHTAQLKRLDPEEREFGRRFRDGLRAGREAPGARHGDGP